MNVFITIGLILIALVPLINPSRVMCEGTNYCARMIKAKPWDIGREVQIDCGNMVTEIASVIRKPPDLVGLSQLSKAGAIQRLGKPFHSYYYDNDEVVFFRDSYPMTIYYNKTTGRPIKISLSLVGVKNINNITTQLGLGSSSPPMAGPAGPFWNDIGVFKQIEVHYPDFKLNDDYIYSVILHIDKRPISGEIPRTP